MAAPPRLGPGVVYEFGFWGRVPLILYNKVSSSRCQLWRIFLGDSLLGRKLTARGSCCRSPTLDNTAVFCGEVEGINLTVWLLRFTLLPAVCDLRWFFDVGLVEAFGLDDCRALMQPIV